MKKIVTNAKLLLGLNIFIVASVSAQTKYVSDELSTFLHRGPNNTYKIVGKINSGEEVTVLEQGSNYTLIKDKNNKQGWILSSELSNNPSKTALVSNLTKEVEELKLKLRNINQEWENKTANSGNFIKEMEEKNQAFFNKNTGLESEIKRLNAENETLQLHVDKDKQALVTKYFMYGGSVFGIGLILGFVLPIIAPRRNKDKWKY